MSQRPATARLYARLGSGVVYVCVGVALVIAVPTSTVGALWISRYLGLDFDEYVRLALTWIPLLALGVAVNAWWSREIIRHARSWRGAGRTRERAVELWATAAHAPYVVTRRALLVFSVLQVPEAVLTAHVAGVDPVTIVPVALCHEAGILTGCGLYLYSVELILRPMREDVARHLPDDFEPPGPAWRLRHRALAPLPIVTCFAALTVGAFADLADGAARLAITLVIAVGIAAAAGLVFLVITRSSLDPLDGLLDGVRRVQHGDLSRPVPVTTPDDLGVLAHNFNLMLAGLRDREALREHNAELAEQLQASLARVVAAADDERRRMERDLHDGAQQRLVLIKLKLLGLTPALSEADAQALDEVRADVTAAIAELRDLAHGIYPPALESDGLAAALQDAAKRAAIPARVQCEGPCRYGRELQAAVYFCCLEALQNAAKHAGYGARATITLRDDGTFLRFAISDDGAGFDLARHQAGGGLQNMSDRIGALGGTLAIESSPGLGTTVSGAVPVTAPGAQYSQQPMGSCVTSAR